MTVVYLGSCIFQLYVSSAPSCLHRCSCGILRSHTPPLVPHLHFYITCLFTHFSAGNAEFLLFRPTKPPTHSSDVLSHFSHVRLFTTLWTVARQGPLSVGFSWQEYRSGLSYPPPGDLPNSGIEPSSLKSLALADGKRLGRRFQRHLESPFFRGNLRCHFLHDHVSPHGWIHHILS